MLDLLRPNINHFSITLQIYSLQKPILPFLLLLLSLFLSLFLFLFLLHHLFLQKFLHLILLKLLLLPLLNLNPILFNLLLQFEYLNLSWRQFLKQPLILKDLLINLFANFLFPMNEVIIRHQQLYNRLQRMHIIRMQFHKKAIERSIDSLKTIFYRIVMVDQ